MKKTSTLLWGSISILIGAVIAVLALVRGKWQLPLLISCFALWGLWLIFALLLPAWRSIQSLRRREKRAERERQAMADANLPDDALAQKLLRHVNFRISSHLKSAYPNARWEWAIEMPALFAVQGGTARIRVYGVPDYDFADVTLNKMEDLSCSLVKVVPLHGQEQPNDTPAPNQQPVDPQVWYELQGRTVLENLVADLNSRGHSKLYLKEDGSICIKPEGGDEELIQDAFNSFPEKVYWPRLKDVLEQAGLAATVQDTCIQVAW